MYREAFPALRVRYEDALARVAERERRVRGELAAHLPEELRARLMRLSVAARLEGRDTMEVARAEHAANAYADALDEAIALAPDIERRLVAVPSEAPELEPAGVLTPSLLGRPSSARELARYESVLAGWARRHDDRARIERIGRCAVRATCRAAGCPLACLVEIVSPRGPLTAITVATSVPLGAPRVTVRPGSCNLGLDEPAFEGLFLVAVGSFSAQRVLGRDVRAALLEIARDDVPLLLVQRGVASLRWTFEPTRASLDAAVRVLAPMRDLEVSVSLLRD